MSRILRPFDFQPILVEIVLSTAYAIYHMAQILIDTRLHLTHGLFFTRVECGICICLRVKTSLTRTKSWSTYGFSVFVVTFLHTLDERVQTLYTSCIRIVSNPVYLKASAPNPEPCQ